MFAAVLLKNRITNRRRSEKTALKIGIVSPYYMHRFGGVQTLIRMLRTELVSRGHEVIIIAPRPRLKADQAKTPPGVVLLGVSAEVNFKVPFHTTIPLAASKAEVISRFLQDQQFDVLNIHEPWLPPFSYQIVRAATCPIVATTHGRWPPSLINRSIERARRRYFLNVLKQIDQITAVSVVSQKNVSEVDPDYPVTIIPNAIDTETFRQRIESQRRPGPGYILFLNRLEKRKGAHLLLRAYQHYCQTSLKPPIPLWIAGAGPQRTTLRGICQQTPGLAESVRFLGAVSDAEKFDLLANATIYTSPAPYGESFGIVLLEAMAAGIPLVAGNNEGYRSVLTGTGANALVDPSKRIALGYKIKEMIEDQTSRKKWLLWAESAIKQYDKEVVTDQYETCFQKAVSRAAKAGRRAAN